jgi:hypothetical protein
MPGRDAVLQVEQKRKAEGLEWTQAGVGVRCGETGQVRGQTRTADEGDTTPEQHPSVGPSRGETFADCSSRIS